METAEGPHDPAAALTDVLLQDHDLPDLLTAISKLAAQRLSTDRHVLCGIVLKRNKKNTVVATSSAEAHQMDELQAGFDEGPCLEAQESGTVIRVPDVRYEARWPKYMAQVRHHGLHSVLAVPLVVGTTSTAAMNFYSHDVGAFNGAEGTTAKHYADLAQNRCSQDEAVKILKSASNHRNLKLRVLAEQLVTSRGHQTSTTAFEP